MELSGQTRELHVTWQIVDDDDDDGDDSEEGKLSQYYTDRQTNGGTEEQATSKEGKLKGASHWERLIKMATKLCNQWRNMKHFTGIVGALVNNSCDPSSSFPSTPPPLLLLLLLLVAVGSVKPPSVDGDKALQWTTEKLFATKDEAERGCPRLCPRAWPASE